MYNGCWPTLLLSPSIEHSYNLNNVIIASSSTHKDLGITVSTHLSWSTHYETLLAKAYKILGLLRRTFSSSNCIATKKSLYVALVRSLVTYCSPVWRPQYKCDMAIEKLQKRATKYILSDYMSNYQQRLMALHLLPLMMVFELNDVMFFIRLLKLPPGNFDVGKYVKFCSSSTRSSTRSATYHKLIHSKSKDNITRHQLFNRLPRLWNSLPPIDLSLSISTIKSHLKTLWSYFEAHFDPANSCSLHCTFSAHA